MNKLRAWIIEKLNPAQPQIHTNEGIGIGSQNTFTYTQAFEKLEAVNRGVNFLVNACSSLDYDVKDKLVDGVVSGVKAKTLTQILNTRPNPYQSAQEFRKNLFTDFLLEGTCFIYYDGAFLYHLPAKSVEIITDPKTFIKGYTFDTTINFQERDVFMFKDLSSRSIYRGTSRLISADRTIKTLYAMQQFQENFFENGAVFGLVLTTDNTLSQVAKEKTIQYWLQKYNPKLGGRRPVILDNGLKPHTLNEQNFKDLDFDQALKTGNEKILQALGVPPILLQGGNNANIQPNLRLFYLETVMPVIRGFMSSLERYFGYDIEAVTSTVSALQPDLKDIASYHATLVNGGIITPNEAREALRYTKITGHDDLRIPANIAGSAANPSTGGRPVTGE